MVTQRVAEDAAIEAAVEQLEAGGTSQVINFTDDMKGVIDGVVTLESTTGKTRVYDRETGVASDILNSRLKDTLKRRYPRDHPMAGRTVFLLTPLVEAPLGNVLCLLHPEHPQRAYLDSIGLRNKFCYSAHIASEYDLDGHMRHRHSKEWAIMERAKREAKDDEGRQLLRQQTELLSRMSGQPKDAPVVYPCYEPGCTRFFDSAQGLRMHQTKEHKNGKETNEG